MDVALDWQGQKLDFLLSAGPLLSGKQILGCVVTMTDITERKRAEETLRESEERFRQLTEQSRTIIWEVDAEGLYTYVSPVSEAAWGYRPEEIVGRKRFCDLHPEKGCDAYRTGALEIVARKDAFRNFDKPVQTKNGQVVWVSANGIPILDANGALLGYRGSDADITERKRAEEALRTSEAKFRTLFESSVDGILIADCETKAFKYANPSVCRMLGYSAEELRTMGVQDIHPQDALPRVIAEFEAQARGEKALAPDLPSAVILPMLKARARASASTRGSQGDAYAYRRDTPGLFSGIRHVDLTPFRMTGRCSGRDRPQMYSIVAGGLEVSS